jgi:hypothetical protein
MSLAPIKSIAHMGVFNAFGVMAVFVLSFTLLMAFLSFGRRVPARRASPLELLSAKGGAWMQGSLRVIADFVVRRRVVVLGFFFAVFAISLAGATRLSVDSNWLDDFADDVPLKKTTLKVDEVMGGVANLVLLFDGGSPGSIKEPAVLRDIERMQEWAESNFSLVRKSYSIVDIVRDLNQTFHAEDPAWYRLPESRNLVAQYLLLYETAGGTEADEYVSSDYQRASLELRLKLAPTSHTGDLVRAIDEELARRPLEATTVSLTGIGALWVKLMDYIVWSQIRGFLFAFAIIAVMMCVLFRSWKTGLISMVPNLSPVLLTLGVMGWFGLDLDYTTVSVAAVAMGIAVDDTIHLVSRYRHEFELCGNYEEALLAAVLDVGRALLITSVALVCGFLVLLFSSLASQAAYGILLATTIVTALVADFLLMPALVLTFQPFGPEGLREDASGRAREAA